jgi:hypothetical protein
MGLPTAGIEPVTKLINIGVFAAGFGITALSIVRAMPTKSRQRSKKLIRTS